VRASKLGASVILIEKNIPGGACLNRACIPTKTLLHSLELLRSINNASSFGIDAGPANINLAGLREYKNKIVSLMNGGLRQTLQQSGVSVISGSASLRDLNNLKIIQNDGITETLNARHIIVASGSVPCRLEFPGFQGTDILYSSDVLELKHIPASLIIVGGGVVGVELGTIMSGLGTSVSIIELTPRILSCEDPETALVFEQVLRKDGVKIYPDSKIIRLETLGSANLIHFTCAGTENKLEAESVCVAVGQKPFIEGLGLAGYGVKTGPRGIAVDTHMRTNVPSVFAAGDVTGNSMLAYVAMAEGRIAAENALGLDTEMEYTAVPRCIYGHVELASVGLTESQAIAANIKVKVLRSRMAANASAAILGERRGLIKIVATEDGKNILGVHIAGTGASNLIAECALALKLGASVGDLERTLHPHPTLSESIGDAALNWNN
jgi:dihydrolipoamide dehydrogenase